MSWINKELCFLLVDNNEWNNQVCETTAEWTSAANHFSFRLPLPRWPHWFIHFHASSLRIWNILMKTELNCQGRVYFFSSHRLLSAKARHDYDQNTTFTGESWVCHNLSRLAVVCLCLPVCESSPDVHLEQKLVLRYIGSTAGEAPHLQRFLIVVWKGGDKFTSVTCPVLRRATDETRFLFIQQSAHPLTHKLCLTFIAQYFLESSFSRVVICLFFSWNNLFWGWRHEKSVTLPSANSDWVETMLTGG